MFYKAHCVVSPPVLIPAESYVNMTFSAVNQDVVATLGLHLHHKLLMLFAVDGLTTNVMSKISSESNELSIAELPKKKKFIMWNRPNI